MRCNDPYFTSAKFDSVCTETGKQIKRGDRIAYYPRSKKAYHVDSASAESLRGLQFSSACGMADANW